MESRLRLLSQWSCKSRVEELFLTTFKRSEARLSHENCYGEHRAHSGRVRYTHEERRRLRSTVMCSDDKVKRAFPLWWTQHQLGGREWISVWIGFNLPIKQYKAGGALWVFSILPREYGCTRFMLLISVAHCQAVHSYQELTKTRTERIDCWEMSSKERKQNTHKQIPLLILSGCQLKS